MSALSSFTWPCGSHAEIFGHSSSSSVGANCFCSSRNVHWVLPWGAWGSFPRWASPKLTPFVEDGNHEGLKQAPLRPAFSYSDRHHSADRRLRTCLFRCCGADCGARGETLFIWRPTQPSRKKSSGELFYEWRRGVRQGKAAKSGQASICVTGEENRASLRQACTGGGCAAVPARRRFRFRYRVSEERGTHDPSFRKMSTVRNLTRWQ